MRDDGLCGGCYDNRMAEQFGLSYGKYVAIYGHNLVRVNPTAEIRRKCPVCGRYLSQTAGKKLVFCSSFCAARAEAERKSDYIRRSVKKEGGE